MGQIDRCDLCDTVRALFTALRRVPRDSATFNHVVDVIESLTRLAVQDTEEALVFRGDSVQERGNAEPTQDEPTSTETRWSGSSGWADDRQWQWRQ